MKLKKKTKMNSIVRKKLEDGIKKNKKGKKRAPTQHINFEISRLNSLPNLRLKSFCVEVAPM